MDRKSSKDVVGSSNAGEQEDRVSVLDMLYDQYQESEGKNGFLVNALFCQLCVELRVVEDDVSNRILALVCALCGDYEKTGYIAGIKTGAWLQKELTESSQ